MENASPGSEMDYYMDVALVTKANRIGKLLDDSTIYMCIAEEAAARRKEGSDVQKLIWRAKQINKGALLHCLKGLEEMVQAVAKRFPLKGSFSCYLGYVTSACKPASSKHLFLRFSGVVATVFVLTTSFCKWGKGPATY
ncbi:hypothetical protein AVEN_136636-1 [Araneus ventricosus]|uniref:Uncharacterized protein n=1 Tax=Araneus ventricosus TaxID=182803 RepID=A0A4Y2CCM6_ARAVE|nr:hypothetical protein AVEN_136636-1 [Araneus ventricosus]